MRPVALRRPSRPIAASAAIAAAALSLPACDIEWNRWAVSYADGTAIGEAPAMLAVGPSPRLLLGAYSRPKNVLVVPDDPEAVSFTLGEIQVDYGRETIPVLSLVPLRPGPNRVRLLADNINEVAIFAFRAFEATS